MKYKLQWFDGDNMVWSTFFTYESLLEALEGSFVLAGSKLSPVRIVMSMELEIYKYNMED